MKVGDWVVHSRHGVGRVESVEVKEYGPQGQSTYYRIAIRAGTVWVPVEGSPSGLRKLTASRELAHFRGVLSGRPRLLPSDQRERRAELTERLKVSSFEAKCEVVRDLVALAWKRPLDETSGALLRTAREELTTEWAAARGVALVVAHNEVEALLLESKEVYDR